MGKLIIIEGTDGSGKQTQTGLLYEKLCEIKGREKVRKISFPNYESKASEPVKMYLSGEFGEKADSVNAYAASVLFSVDRFASFKTEWEEFYNNGGIVLSDRYTISNMIHQASKIKDREEREKYLDWLVDLEWNKIGIPKPNLVFFLDIPFEFSQKLMKDRKNKITEEITTLLLFIMIIILSSATTFLYSLVFIIMTNDWLPGEETQYLYLLFLGIMMLLNAFLVSRFIRYQKNNKNDHKKVLIFPCMIAFFSLLLIVILSENFSVRMLYPVRFTEIPQNSSWYLLHNNFQQNNGFQETSGIDRNDLLKLKQKFKCSALSEKEKVEKGISCSAIPEQRNNALYGYMAWNLGDTKVFCPPTAENNKGKKEAAKLATECIVISGKFLQILNENYIDIMPKER